MDTGQRIGAQQVNCLLLEGAQSDATLLSCADSSLSEYAGGRRYTGHTLAKFVITMVSGILTGVFAVGLGSLAGGLIEWKNGFVQELLDEEGQHRVFMAFLWHSAYSCLLVSFAVALVRTAATGPSTYWK